MVVNLLHCAASMASGVPRRPGWSCKRNKNRQLVLVECTTDLRSSKSASRLLAGKFYKALHVEASTVTLLSVRKNCGKNQRVKMSARISEKVKALLIRRREDSFLSLFLS